MSFATPVPITANTTYVASYHTNVGGYAFDGAYFATAGVDSPPLHALPSNTSGGNGVFTLRRRRAFPTQTFNANNYWVDVVFAASLSDIDGAGDLGHPRDDHRQRARHDHLDDRRAGDNAYRLRHQSGDSHRHALDAATRHADDQQRRVRDAALA